MSEINKIDSLYFWYNLNSEFLKYRYWYLFPKSIPILNKKRVRPVNTGVKTKINTNRPLKKNTTIRTINIKGLIII